MKLSRPANFAACALLALSLSGCPFGSKSSSGGGGDAGGGGGVATPSAPDPYAGTTLSYANVSDMTEHYSITPLTPTSNIGNMNLLTNFRSSPQLPNGLSINQNTGEISGTVDSGWPSAAYTISATTPSGGAASTTLTFGVYVSGQSQADTTIPYEATYAHSEVVYTIGTPISPNTPSNLGPAITSYADSYGSQLQNLGLSIDTTTGVISGTPNTVFSRAPITVYGNYSGGMVGLTIYVTVLNGPPTSLTYSTAPATYPVGSAITANNPSSSGGAVASYSVAPALPAGLVLDTSTGAISGTPTAVAAAANYVLTATNAAGSTTFSLSITISNAAPGNLNYAANPARYTVGAAITANTPSIGSGGAATSYSVSPSLPAGLSIDAGTGVISGTPTGATSSGSYTVTATNAIGSTTKAVTIVVVTPGTHTVYTGDGATIRAYSVDTSTGEPVYLGKSISGSVNTKLLFHPTLDCGFGYTGSTVYAFAIDKANYGALTLINSAGGSSGARNLEMTSDGAFLFTVNDQDPNTQFLARYSVNSSTCAVTSLGSTSVWDSTTIFSRDLAVAGNNVYMINTAANVKHFTVDGSGGLTYAGALAMSPHSNPPAASPSVGQGQSLRASADGAYVYAVDSMRAIESFGVNSTSGALTSLGTMVNSGTYYLSTPVIDASTGYLFSNYQSSSDYGIASVHLVSDGSTGTSATISGSSIVAHYAGTMTVAAHASDSGTYVYTTFQNISYSGTERLKVNSSNGVLSPVGAGLWGVLGGY